ncbi:MAG: nucleotide exchange factor GrpE [Bacteroidota bacterium]|nr:nucleotide exchange factor GrpE [Bacteroidota bacterium]
MVKKKSPDAENTNEEKHTESTENKVNTNNEANEGGHREEQLAAEESVKEPSEAEAEAEKEPDKVIPAEKPAEEKLADMQDRYLRLAAEFDNYRKRTLKEKMEISKFAGEDLIRKILPVMDDFERALKSAEASPECKGMKDGIELIYNKLSDFLKLEGLKEIDSLSRDFNVDLHDAVATVPVEDEKRKGKIIEVILKGYYLKDKVLRHSRVVVGE